MHVSVSVSADESLLGVLCSGSAVKPDPAVETRGERHLADSSLSERKANAPVSK